MLVLEEQDPEDVKRDTAAALEFANQVWELLDGQSIILQCTVIQTLIVQLMEFLGNREERHHLGLRIMDAVEDGLEMDRRPNRPVP
jgi:hypothetical protein